MTVGSLEGEPVTGWTDGSSVVGLDVVGLDVVGLAVVGLDVVGSSVVGLPVGSWKNKEEETC